jgi:hypothetical protein
VIGLALFKWPNRISVPLTSSEDGNRSSLLNVVFSSYVEFRTMDEVHKSSHSEWHTPSSELFMDFTDR